MKINKKLNLNGVNSISCDVETYGLKFEDRMFSLQIVCEGGDEYYYNLQKYEDAPWVPVISPEELKELVKGLESFTGTVFGANLIYDLQKLGLFNIHLPQASLHCTHTFERLLKSEDIPKLDDYSKNYGYEKLDIAKKYIDKHKLYDPKSSFEGITIPKKPRYDLLPWSVISEYGMVDARITLDIGLKQEETLKHINKDLVSITKKTTRNLLSIYNQGISLDIDHCKKRFEHHKKICFDLLNRQKEGFNANSKIFLKALFKEHKLPIEYNYKTKEPIFNNEVISKYKHIPIFQDILTFRDHYKLYRSFYFNLIYYSHKDKLHLNLNPYGTATSRFSTSRPALQTLPRDNKEVKQAIIPSPDSFFLEMDFSAMEMRLAFDLSGEFKAIAAVKQGLDIHQEKADKIGTSRQNAKTVVFSKLYGSGIKRIAAQTGLSFDKAKKLFIEMDSAYPKLKILSDKLKKQAEIFKLIKNYYGRPLHIPKDKAYKALNYYIQSQGADIIRVAINQILEFIKINNLKTVISLTVHDSILLNIPFNEAGHQAKFKELMESAYIPKNGLPMSVDCKHSLKSYGDMQDGLYKN